MVFLYWYAVCGIAFGLFVMYMIMKEFKTWQALCDDFNKSEMTDAFLEGREVIDLTPNVAKYLIPTIVMILFAFIWLPFLVYVGWKRV